MFFNIKAPIWLISLFETSSIYICLPGVKVGKVTVQPKKDKSIIHELAQCSIDLLVGAE